MGKDGERGKMIECDEAKKNEYEKEILNEKKLKKEEKNKISNFIKNYGKEVGLPNLCLNNENICSLNFDGKINIDIKYNEKSSICPFVSPICSIPDKNKEEFYKKLLLANSFGIENGGAVLSIYKEKNSIIFSFSFIVSTFSYELFKNVLNNFTTIVEKNMDKYEKMLNQN